jgi:hypothetical protein
MKTRVARGLALLSVLATLVACEEEKPKSVAPAAPTAPPIVNSSPPLAQTAKKEAERPSKIDTELTPARRAAIESRYPATKGFLAASDLQAKLKADKSLKDKKAAVAAFDKLARGKWVLFTGPLVNLNDDSFDIGLEYTPQLPNDPMGMSRQFFEVGMKQIEGYTKAPFKDGNVGIVLVKYNGAATASPGYELVALGTWS